MYHRKEIEKQRKELFSRVLKNALESKESIYINFNLDLFVLLERKRKRLFAQNLIFYTTAKEIYFSKKKFRIKPFYKQGIFLFPEY